MKLRKIISLALICAMGTTVLTGCGETSHKSGDGAVLKWVMPGPGMQTDSQKVWKEFNLKLSQKLPGVQVEFEIIPLSEYKQKFMLMCSSREKIDIASNYGLDYSKEVNNGTFAPLDDLLKEYGQDVTAALPELVFDYMKVNGQIYGIPNYQQITSYRSINFVTEEYEKYMDDAKFKEVLYSSEQFNEEMYVMLEEYLEKLEADGIHYPTANVLNLKGYEQLVGRYGVRIGDGSFKVEHSDAADKFRFEVAREWYEKGLIRKDVLSAQDSGSANVIVAAFWDTGWSPGMEEKLSAQYGVDVTCIPYDNDYFIGYQNAAGGTSIMAASEYQAEAMQVLNLVNSDKELYNLLTYGIENDHYKKTGEDSIEVEAAGGQGTTADRYGIYKWIVGNTELAYIRQDESSDMKDWAFNTVNKSENKSPLIGFVVDTSNIIDAVTQVNAVDEEYQSVLYSGALDNWEEYYSEWEQERKTAGEDKIIEDLERQIQEFLKNK